MSSKKQYGLIIPNEKKSAAFEAKRNVFGSDSDEDEAPAMRKRPLLDTNESTKKQVKLMQQKAVEEDPTVFQYDELYDDIQQKKSEAVSIVKKDRAPKYIENLMITATKRKREQERREERKIQKEREMEGEEFADKEAFVTSSYKKKLEELKKEEELEKREAYLEEIGDVTKQTDLGGFYRHIYEQKLSDKKPPKLKTPSPKIGSPHLTPTNSPERKDNTQPSSEAKSRNYRKKMTSNEVDSDLSEGEVISESEDKEVNREGLKTLKSKNSGPANIDADSDFSIESSSDSANEKDSKKNSEIIVGSPKENTTKDKEHPKISLENKENVDLTPDHSERSLTPPPKVDIWAKRTVGVKFEEALKRYYERKSARLSGM